MTEITGRRPRLPSRSVALHHLQRKGDCRRWPIESIAAEIDDLVEAAGFGPHEIGLAFIEAGERQKRQGDA